MHLRHGIDLCRAKVRAFFESLEMNASDAWTLFASLDADGDGAISSKAQEYCWQFREPHDSNT